MNGAQIASDVGNNSIIPHRESRHLQQRAINDSESAAYESDIDRERRRSTMLSRRLHTTIFYLLTLLFIYFGWQYNNHLYLVPEQGLGYALGITGGLMMVLLLLYPLRKHARWAQGFGPVRYWFRGHMLMGVLGPVCILFHCNYQLGSTNGNIALFSMLLVAGSGLVGRYFYTKIHYGLYGRKADLVHLGSDTAMAKAELEPVFDIVPGMKSRLQSLEEKAISTQHGFLSSLASVLVINIRSRWCWFGSVIELHRFFSSATLGEKLTREQRRYYYRKTRYYLQIYLYTVRKVAGFAFFERLFSMWHILHLPLFVMLLIAGIVHVYAVHMY
jgi:hypothetical protein